TAGRLCFCKNTNHTDLANPRNRVQHVDYGFFALCILSIDFKICFFFKLVYGEKRRAKPRRLPPFPCPSNH
ncbi:MAG TPA: hypothetical protein VKB90_16105, partial [Candidatus Acidoferrum sp.]|nr:hypothetical protein [Candidatus Acidoferrum sp.]